MHDDVNAHIFYKGILIYIYVYIYIYIYIYMYIHHEFDKSDGTDPEV
jgi:hypothetical protein